MTTKDTATMNPATYDRILTQIVTTDDEANARYPQYRDFWAPDDAGPFLVEMTHRFTSKGDHTVIERGEIVVAKMTRLDGGPWYIVAGARYPGHHSLIPTSWARRITPSEQVNE